MKKIKLLTVIAITGVFLLSDCKKKDPELKAVITVVSSAAPGDTITLDASQSVGENLSYEWTVGGPITVSLPSGNSSSYVNVSFIAEKNGTYNIQLRIYSGSSFNDALATVTVTGSKTLSGTLTESITLINIGDFCDYVITGDLIVPSGIILDIEPQTTLCFADGVGLIVEGRLNADQAEFKAYGTNWKGIHFKSAVGYITNCTIDKGGSASYTSSADENANITMTSNSNINDPSVNIISNSAGYGIVMENGSSIDNNTSYIFKTNTKGPGIFTAFTVLESNFNLVLDSATTGTYINVRGTSSSITTAIFYNTNLPYMVLGDITISGDLNSIAIVYFADGFGLTAEQINITGGKFSSINQIAGSWKGIFCNLTSGTNIIKDATIEYAGSSPFTYNSVDYTGAIIGGGGGWNISNANISNNTGFGLSVYGVAPMTITNSTINNNSAGAVMVPFDYVDEIVSSTSNNTFTGYTNVPIIWVITSKYSSTSSNLLGTWVDIDGTMSNVDYKMTTNTTILSNNELILEAGVTVQFESDAYWDINSGVLTANGASTMHVRLIGEGASTATGLWKGIYMYGNSNTGLSLNYTDIIGGGTDNTGNYQGNINLNIAGAAGSISIINSQINYSGKYGIYAASATDDYNLKDLANNNVYIGNVTADWNF